MINVVALAGLTRRLIPGMRERGSGEIVGTRGLADGGRPINAEPAATTA